MLMYHRPQQNYDSPMNIVYVHKDKAYGAEFRDNKLYGVQTTHSKTDGVNEYCAVRYIKLLA